MGLNNSGPAGDRELCFLPASRREKLQRRSEKHEGRTEKAAAKSGEKKRLASGQSGLILEEGAKISAQRRDLLRRVWKKSH